MYVLYLWRKLQTRQKVAGGICCHNADLPEGTQQLSQLSCLDCCHAAGDAQQNVRPAGGRPRIRQSGTADTSCSEVSSRKYNLQTSGRRSGSMQWGGGECVCRMPGSLWGQSLRKSDNQATQSKLAACHTAPA